MIFVENVERVVNISQPKSRWGVKCCNSCVFDMFHVNRSNNGRDARTHRSAKDLFEKRVFVRKYSRGKTMFKTYRYVRDSKRSAQDKDSSEVRSSKTRLRALSIGTDVNRLTTSKETKISLWDIVKF